MDFADRHVAVTGGTGVLGAAVVKRLIALGAVCHVPSRGQGSGSPANTAVRLMPGVDLSDEDAVDAFYATVPSLWASIHVAGGFAMASVADTSKDDLMRQIDTNLVSCFLCCRAAITAMRSRTGGEASGGRIVNVAARPALEPRTGAGMSAYTASKAAVAALTVALAQEVAGEGIWVNAVAPSIIDTPANRTAMPKADHSAWPAPVDIAETIVFLASPGNQSTRGAIIPVYGRS